MQIFGIIGWKNAGKTGLMERLVTEITGRGISVSTLKHAHHTFDVDQAGKDSFRHRLAGANEVLLASQKRWALMHESRDEIEPPLAELLARLSAVDLVLVEGFKRDGHAKIEVNRDGNRERLIAPVDPTVVAIASDKEIENVAVPILDLNDTCAVADFVLAQSGLSGPETIPPPELVSKPLRDDCFALPDGVDWVPVDTALAQLRANFHTVVGQDTVPLSQALGRILAEDILALRSNPPGGNSAVDGYGFAFSSVQSGANKFTLVDGRSAAGSPLNAPVPNGQAVRILTGALLPDGVDTVVMQEDVDLAQGAIIFDGAIKPGANARSAGEDIQSGNIALKSGHKIVAADLAYLAAVGQEKIPVHQKLRVGVLSTGDEIVPAGETCGIDQTFDANRPMLLGLAQTWGHRAVDLGHVGDDRAALRDCLNHAADTVDVILTSGGASAGDEDHVSALLAEEAKLFSWRIALKPGRPLALGLWNGVPIFGLPGNPVAAFICTLIFARPAFGVLAGGEWQEPRGFHLKAAFAKSKKAGRREYLRARINNAGDVEKFASEGSGRISGLSWSDGVVELSDEPQEINIGDYVRYIPYSSFGL